LLVACGGSVASQANGPDAATVVQDSGIVQRDATAGDGPLDSGIDSSVDASDVTVTDATGDDGGEASSDAMTDGPLDAPADVPLDAPAALDLCQAEYGSALPSFQSCCTASDKLNARYASTVTLFENFVNGQCYPDLGRSLTRGRITIDPGLTAQCAADQASYFATNPACYQFLYSNSDLSGPYLFARPSCDAALTGLQALGQPCAYDYECQNGLTCVGWTNTSDGVCRIPSTTAGQPCFFGGTGGATIPDYYFGTHPLCGPGYGCAAGETCEPVGALGQSCGYQGCVDGGTCTQGICRTGGPSGIGGPCAGTDDCLLGLRCWPSDAGPESYPDSGYDPVCESPLAPGMPCGSNSDCEGICNQASLIEAGTCIRFCNGP
jgi:hypothetical protein